MLDVEVHFWPDRFCGETKRTLTATSGAWKRVDSEGQEGPTQRPCGGVNKTNMTGQRMSGNDVSVMIIKLYDSSS